MARVPTTNHNNRNSNTSKKPEAFPAADNDMHTKSVTWNPSESETRIFEMDEGELTSRRAWTGEITQIISESKRQRARERALAWSTRSTTHTQANSVKGSMSTGFSVTAMATMDAIAWDDGGDDRSSSELVCDEGDDDTPDAWDDDEDE